MVADRDVRVRQQRARLAQPPLVAKTLRDGRRASQVAQYAGRLAQWHERVPKIELEVDRKPRRLVRGRDMAEGVEGLLEVLYRFTMGRLASGLRAARPIVGGGLFPRLRGAEMKRECRVVRLQIVGVELFQRARDGGVHELSSHREDLAQHHVSDAFVDEIKAFSDAVQHAAAYELLHTGGRLALTTLRRPRQQRELEVAADDRRHRGHSPCSLSEPLQTASDDTADTSGQ